ncbi:MAG: hypothetical protein LBS31_02780, partial [Candidatus Adiutrix sp.]|nr:hypothetical protein [Candidatus Adiutrix sp.]
GEPVAAAYARLNGRWLSFDLSENSGGAQVISLTVKAEQAAGSEPLEISLISSGLAARRTLKAPRAPAA